MSETSPKLDARSLSKALGWALVEIRAAQDLKVAQGLADVFHNVPSALNAGRPISETVERMLECADRNGNREYVLRILKAAT